MWYGCFAFLLLAMAVIFAGPAFGLLVGDVAVGTARKLDLIADGVRGRALFIARLCAPLGVCCHVQGKAHRMVVALECVGILVYIVAVRDAERPDDDAQADARNDVCLPEARDCQRFAGELLLCEHGFSHVREVRLLGVAVGRGNVLHDADGLFKLRVRLFGKHFVLLRQQLYAGFHLLDAASVVVAYKVPAGFHHPLQDAVFPLYQAQFPVG